MKTRTTAAIAAMLACASALAPAWGAEPIITTFAGGSPGPASGDGGPATSAYLLNPVAVAVDAAGNVYVAEGNYYGYTECRIRKIAPNGIISTIAGNGTTAPGKEENVPATSVAVCPHGGLAVDAQGNVFVGEYSRVRRITPGGILSTVAGSGTSGFSGDGGPATSARFADIHDVAFDASGNLYIADGTYRVRKVDGAGIVRTVAGNGNHVASGDRGPATAAAVAPQSVAFDSAGNMYISDRLNRAVRRVTPDGIIRTWAGGHFRNDPVAINAQQFYPAGIAIDARNSLFVANRTNFVRVIGTNGIQAFVAGPFIDTFYAFGAEEGFSGDGGPARDARLWEPEDVAVDAAGNLYVADLRNHRVRKITPVAPPRKPAGVNAFAPHVVKLVGSYTEDVAVGDVNGDGRLDAILTTSAWTYMGEEPDNDWKLHAFLQKADGTLSAPIERSMGWGRYVKGLAVADFNEDGRADAVVTDQNGVHVYPGGANGFGAGIVWPNVGTAKGGGSVAVSDLDGDGHMDVLAFALSNEDGGGTGTGLTLFYGNGKGGVARKRLIQPEPLTWAKPLLFDATGDGRQDLLLPWDDHAGNDSGLLVYPHDGIDSFSSPYRLHVGERNFVAGRTVGDFDGDGLLDIIVSRDGNTPSALAYLRQTSRGWFKVQRRWGTYDGASTLLGADMDTDGRDDLLVTHSGWSSVGYLQQATLAGQSWLHDEVKYYQHESGHPTDESLAVGDLNGDGCPDIATSDYNYGLQVHYGKGCKRMRNGSAPLLPPGAPGSATVGGATVAVPVAAAGGVSASAAGVAGAESVGDVRWRAWTETVRTLFVRGAAWLRAGWDRLWAAPPVQADVRRFAAATPPVALLVVREHAPVCRAGDRWEGQASAFPATARMAGDRRGDRMR